MSEVRGNRKVRVGVVVSDKMDKDHCGCDQNPRQARPVRQDHEPYHQAQGARRETTPVAWGDVVRVMETRPLSREKRWRLVEIVEKAK